MQLLTVFRRIFFSFCSSSHSLRQAVYLTVGGSGGGGGGGSDGGGSGGGGDDDDGVVQVYP